MTNAERYRNNGFLVYPTAVLPSDVIDEAVLGVDAIRRGEYDRGQPPERSPWNPGDGTDRLCKIEQPQRASQGIFDLVSQRRIGELAAQVTGAEWIQVWWVQLLYKPVGVETEHAHVSIGWHQDRYYWGCWKEGSELLTAWVALSDVSDDCGPMRFVPGSHRWGLIDGGDFDGGDLDAIRNALSLPQGADWTEQAALMAAGGLSLHDRYTLHGSGENQSDRPRRSLALHLRTQNSYPVDGTRQGLTRYIDDESTCPVIYGAQRSDN